MKITTKNPFREARDELENKFREQIEELTRVTEKLKLEIIDLKQAGPELQSIQEYLDIVLFNMPVGVAILEGPEFRYFRINQVLADLNGLPVEEHLGRRLEDVLPKAALGILPNLRRVFENGEAILAREFSVRLPSNPGNEVNLVDWHFPITVDGRIKAVGAIVMDITARKLAEEALKKSEEKYRLLFDNIPDVIITADEKGVIISANKSVKRILGYEPSELLGKPVEILAPEGLRSEQKKLINNAVNKGFKESQETIRIAKDGTWIPIDISVFTSKDSTGNLLGVSAIIKHIKERKRT